MTFHGNYSPRLGDKYYKNSMVCEVLGVTEDYVLVVFSSSGGKQEIKRIDRDDWLRLASLTIQSGATFTTNWNSDE